LLINSKAPAKQSCPAGALNFQTLIDQAGGGPKTTTAFKPPKAKEFDIA
jgi:hypothetical protein